MVMKYSHCCGFGYHLPGSTSSTHLPVHPDVDSILDIWNDTRRFDDCLDGSEQAKGCETLFWLILRSQKNTWELFIISSLLTPLHMIAER